MKTKGNWGFKSNTKWLPVNKNFFLITFLCRTFNETSNGYFYFLKALFDRLKKCEQNALCQFIEKFEVVFHVNVATLLG